MTIASALFAAGAALVALALGCAARVIGFLRLGVLRCSGQHLGRRSRRDVAARQRKRISFIHRHDGGEWKISQHTIAAQKYPEVSLQVSAALWGCCCGRSLPPGKPAARRLQSAIVVSGSSARDCGTHKAVTGACMS